MTSHDHGEPVGRGRRGDGHPGAWTARGFVLWIAALMAAWLVSALVALLFLDAVG